MLSIAREGGFPLGIWGLVLGFFAFGATVLIVRSLIHSLTFLFRKLLAVSWLFLLLCVLFLPEYY